MLPDGKVLAAVDIGSNSIHLIVARIVKGALQPMQRYRERVQLAAGLTDDGLLDSSASERGLNCLEKIGKLLVDHKPDYVRVVATYTLRHAKNRNEFLRIGEKVLGYPIEVISGREEARLIFQGVAHAETLKQNTLVIDIGGGSTELALGKGFDPHFAESCRMGCVSFRQQFFSEGVTKKTFYRAYKEALQSLEKYLPRLHRLNWQSVYVTSGTAKALMRICSQGDTSQNTIELKHLSALRQKLILKENADWLLAADIGDDRIGLVPSGLAILLAIMDSLEITKARYRDVALREGVLYEMDHQMRHPDIRERTRDSLQALYRIDKVHAGRVAETITDLLERLGEEWPKMESSASLDFLTEAAHLHEIGIQISSNSLQRHSAYILENSDMPGYNQEQQIVLSTLVRWHRKRIKVSEFPELRIVSKKIFLHMLFVLRFAIIINMTRKPINVEKINLSYDDKILVCGIGGVLLQKNPLFEADLIREQAYLAEVGIDLIIK